MNAFAIIGGVVLISALWAVAFGLWIKFCWWLVIPDVFAALVAKGLIPASITWWQATKFGIFASIFKASLSKSKSD